MDARTNQSIVWDAVPAAEDYEVECSYQGGGLVSSTVVTVPSIPVATAAAGQALGATLRVRVRARDAWGAGDWTDYLNFTLVGLPAPGNLAIV